MRRPRDGHHITFGQRRDVLSNREYPSNAGIAGPKRQSGLGVGQTQPLGTLGPWADRRHEYLDSDLTATRQRHFHRHQLGATWARDDDSQTGHRTTPAGRA